MDRVVWERWETPVDVRMCGRCWVLAGLCFRRGEGPVAPLHEGCRCAQRVVARRVVAESGAASERVPV